MKRLFTLCAIVIAVAVSSCSKFDDTPIWDKLNNHESRITALEELCKQMNTNIDALQTLVEALEKRDYITNVSPVRKDGEVIGYTISFADSDTITIYHGENGQDGADGKDGYTPQIGVMKDTDGIYYWTLDGEWLLDGKGNKIQANGVNGIDGTDGSNGQDGTNGVDGITPRLKIENDYWYVSYDEGATWIELGKATGEDGTDGSNGEDGDNIFASVTQDDEYVYFNLADGTMITLPKHDKENIQFEDLRVKAICCKNWDTNNDGELSYAEAAAVTDIGTVFMSNTDIIAFTEFKYFTGLTEIPSNAFYKCQSLWKIEIPETVTDINYEAFYNCKSLSNINLEHVCTIAYRAFYECSSLKEIKLCGDIVSIEDNAFYKCNFECLDIACNQLLGSVYPFASCSFSHIRIEKNVSKIDCKFSGCTATELYYNDNISAWCNIYFGERSNPMSFVTNVIIDNNVLGGDLVIPNNIEIINAGCFNGCSSITSVVIPNSVLSIEERAFCDCANLTNITIGENVKMIKDKAFGATSNECSRYQDVVCLSKMPPTCASNAFKYEYKDQYNQSSYRMLLNHIYVPALSLDLYKSDWLWGKNYIYTNPYE